MSFKYTKHRLKKIEELFTDLDYKVRYERGNFQAGYCIVEQRNIVVINRYYDTEARINCLLDILGKLEIEVDRLPEKQQAHYQELYKFWTTHAS